MNHDSVCPVCKCDAAMIALTSDAVGLCLYLLEEWFNKLYPPDIFTGESGDAGSLEIVAIRNKLQSLLAKAQSINCQACKGAANFQALEGS